MTSTAVRPPRSEPAAAEPPRDWLSGKLWTRYDVMAAGAVFVVMVALVWLLRTSIVPTDPWNYVQAARNFPADTWVPLGYTRYGMILPLLPIVALFGNSEMTFYFWPLVGSGLMAACLYLIGVRFWNRSTGLLAIVLASSGAVVFGNLSRAYPDVQSTAVFLLAVVIAFYARDRREVTGVAPVIPLLAVGFLLGWAFEARETTALTWPIIAIILWQRKGLLRVAGLVVAAMAVWAVADIAIGYFAYGDAWIRVTAFTRQDLAAGQLPGDQAAKAELVGRDRLFYLLAIPRYLLTTVPHGGWTLLLGVLALSGFAFRSTRFVALFFALAFFGFVGITGGFSPERPTGRIDVARYWVPFLVLAGLAAAGVVYELSRILTRRLERISFGGVRVRQRGVLLVLAIVVAVGPVVGLIAELRTNTALVVNGATQLSQARSYLAANASPDTRIWTDYHTKRLLGVYETGPFGGPPLWSADVKSLSPKSKLKPGDYVLVNSLEGDSCYFCRGAITRYLETIGGEVPASWQEVWATPERTMVLYRVP